MVVGVVLLGQAAAVMQHWQVLAAVAPVGRLLQAQAMLLLGWGMAVLRLVLMMLTRTSSFMVLLVMGCTQMILSCTSFLTACMTRTPWQQHAGLCWEGVLGLREAQAQARAAAGPATVCAGLCLQMSGQEDMDM